MPVGHHFDMMDIKNIPKGKISIVEALTLLNNHKLYPETWTAKKIAQEYHLELNDVNSLLKYFVTFEVKIFPPEDKKAIQSKWRKLWKCFSFVYFPSSYIVCFLVFSILNYISCLVCNAPDLWKHTVYWALLTSQCCLWNVFCFGIYFHLGVFSECMLACLIYISIQYKSELILGASF